MSVNQRLVSESGHWLDALLVKRRIVYEASGSNGGNVATCWFEVIHHLNVYLLVLVHLLRPV